jgi:hypothetical protein
MRYLIIIVITVLTSGIFTLHVPISTAAFLEISKNTLSKCYVHFYREYGHIIIFFILLMVVSQNQKTQFFLKHLVYIYQFNLQCLFPPEKFKQKCIKLKGKLEHCSSHILKEHSNSNIQLFC